MLVSHLDMKSFSPFSIRRSKEELGFAKRLGFSGNTAMSEMRAPSQIFLCRPLVDLGVANTLATAFVSALSRSLPHFNSWTASLRYSHLSLPIKGKVVLSSPHFQGQ